MNVSLIDYMRAMDIVQSYEKSLTPSEGESVCTCEKCRLKFIFEIGTHKRESFHSGTYYYYGDCPYCGKETLLMKY
jgi:hypothetical protein